MDMTLRMTWRDPRDAVVHAVELNLRQFVSRGRWPIVAAAIADSPPAHACGSGTLQTVCGEDMPMSWDLYLDEPVTCEQCLAAEGDPAIAEALRVINQRVPAGAGL